MRLTRKKAIELCIELWEWCAKTGKRKGGWPGWEKYDVAIEHHSYCWFCYYDNHTEVGGKRARGGECIFCPYRKKFGYHCNNDGPQTLFNKWDDAKTPRTRKKYAKLFLNQIKDIK
ncbi:MAG: hypothetical protein KAS32_07550 [Candidatus Peribacteraceae bacterium]|nr:hypothetical protein [Candidatus Peribacteraceae bacterium]